MIHHSYTIRFVLHRRSDTARNYLQMRVTPRGGKPVSFATGLSLTPDEWDPLLGRAKGRTVAAAEANTLIAHWSQLVANIFTHYDSLKIIPDAERLRQSFAHATQLDEGSPDYTPQPAASLTIIQAFTQFIITRQRECSWSAGTVAVLQSFRRLLGEYQPDTPLESIDADWLAQFHNWLVRERRQQGVTVNGNLVKMRWFFHWARRKDYYHGDADKEYRPKVKGASERTRSIIYLSRDELRRVEDFQFDEPHYNVARDVFVFCCYTGLRSSDILKLSRADIHGDSITFTTVKTNHTLTVPLNAKAKAILQRYEGCAPNRQQKIIGLQHPALPTPGKKTLNKHLHAMMQIIGLDAPTHHTYYIGDERFDEIVPKYQLITTHTARHTFIVNAVALNIPIPVILSWTGHHNYSAMLPYIAIANETATDAMQRFNTLTN